MYPPNNEDLPECNLGSVVVREDKDGYYGIAFDPDGGAVTIKILEFEPYRSKYDDMSQT